MWTSAASGMGLGLGLIVAIGAQNAFVLRQGLRREHVFAVAAFCALADALLIALGLAGLSGPIAAVPALGPGLRWAGAAFLAGYGALALRRALSGAEALDPGQAPRQSLRAVIATLAAITFLNPHVWLDTVVLLGSVGASHAPHQLAFGLGAATGSVLFFFGLAYGARLLAPLFARPGAWRVLDGLIAAVMWVLALGLALGG
ncbi:LysE/ArgO family amino acid transporter [Frigidibacter sp. MR17.14]|uniref:LysE/ArgO family amino acid transporter n=1 Tax=Frigidibacter sp. MR17.14 TaxID=3126509 RepID=UPI003012FC46